MVAHFLFLLSLLLLLSSAEATRQLAEAPEVAKEGEGEKMMVEGVMIGSRPPSCEGRCSGCGHCEAVQVPLAPLKKQMTAAAATTTTVNSRGDEYSSNYKPMNWRCKCGDRILNP